MLTPGDHLELDPLIAQAKATWTKEKPFKPNMALRFVLRLAEKIFVGTLHIILPDGQLCSFVGSSDPTKVRGICVVLNDRFAWKFLIRGILGFCEAYLAGDWVSPDMTSLFALAVYNERDFLKVMDGRVWWRRLEGTLNMFRRNTRKGSQRNIAHHYDLGNTFYETWLDKSMTYSSGVFASATSENDLLYQSQQQKYKSIATMLDLQPHHKVLEIGCGWGGFAEYAAREIGCHITGLTISREQLAYAKERMERAGISDKVDLQLCDYRDCQGEYDRVVSIEMFEAVGEKYWPEFFDVLYNRLRVGGVAAMQVITIAPQYFETYRKGADYIQKYIFPGGLLPTFSHLRDHVTKACMEWQREHAFGPDYARTLLEWRQRFDEAWPRILNLGFDERFRRMWEQYLCYCEAGFRSGTIDVCQFSFTKPVTAKA